MSHNLGSAPPAGRLSPLPHPSVHSSDNNSASPASSFPLLDLPTELQIRVLGFCFPAWHARLVMMYDIHGRILAPRLCSQPKQDWALFATSTHVAGLALKLRMESFSGMIQAWILQDYRVMKPLDVSERMWSEISRRVTSCYIKGYWDHEHIAHLENLPMLKYLITDDYEYGVLTLRHENQPITAAEFDRFDLAQKAQVMEPFLQYWAERSTQIGSADPEDIFHLSGRGIDVVVAVAFSLVLHGVNGDTVLKRTINIKQPVDNQITFLDNGLNETHTLVLSLGVHAPRRPVPLPIKL